MLFSRSLHPRLVAGALAVLAATAAIAVEATSGRAQVAGATYVITPVGKESLAFSDVKPKGFRHNRFSLGDQLFLTTKIKRDGTVAGTAQATITVSDPHPLKGDRAHGVVSAVYHLADGDLYTAGTVLFDDSGTGRARSSAAPGPMPARAARSIPATTATSCTCSRSGDSRCAVQNVDDRSMR